MVPPDSSAFPNRLAALVERFERLPLPIMQRTHAVLSQMTQYDEPPSAADVAGVVQSDPLLAVRLLREVGAQCIARGRSPAETTTQALLMHGTMPFLASLPLIPKVDDLLKGRRDEMQAVQAVVRRSQRASRLALAFAVHLQDTDAETIAEAALLHEFIEVLAWLVMPEDMRKIEKLHATNAALKEDVVQKHVLGAELSDIEHALLTRWQLPEILVRITDDHESDRQARIVRLATRIARHSRHGWTNPALEADFIEAADLLVLSPEAARERIQEWDPTGSPG